MKDFLFRFTPTSVGACVACIIIGLIMLIWPNFALSLIFTVLACLLIVVGIVLIAKYFLQKEVTMQYDYSMATGVVMLLIGILLLIAPRGVGAMFSYVFGILLLLGGAVKFQGAFDLKRLGDSRWFICLIFSAVAIAAGFVIAKVSFSSEIVLMRFIGIALLAEGLMDGVSSYFYEKDWKAQNGGKS